MSKDSVLGLFRQHADTHPERPALVDRERSFSYRELDRLSDRLAAHLARRGVARGERLPLLAERSAELVIAILAAAKCAAAYVPVDRRQPDRRKQEILRQCQAPVALATQAEDLPGQPVEVIAQVLATSAAGAAPRPALDGSEALYVIFTSGTTGEPKGVVIESRSLSNLVDWHNRRFEMDQRSRTTLMAGVGFDVCQWEIWSTLCAGACLHLVPDEVRPAPAALLAFFAEQRISHAFAPTVMVPALVEQPAPPSLALRYLFCAGKNCRRSQPAGCPIPWWITTARPKPRSSPPAASSTPKLIGGPPRSARPSTVARHSFSTPTTGLAMATGPAS